jgi:hypothetical protein
MDSQQLLKRIEVLEKNWSLLEQSNTIPYKIEKAFMGRGFLQSSNLFLTGYATLNISGEANVPISGASINNIAVAVYADGTGSDIGSVVINGASGVELYLNGTGLATVYWIVFLTANKTL